MDQSPTIKNLSAALAKAQGQLKNPHFDSTNPHFKSKFASLAAVRESVIPKFAECGIALSQWPISKEGAAGCRTVIAHGDEWMAEDFLIPVERQNAHGYASAVTYAKRIAMQSVAGVVGDDDDDANGAVGDVKAQGKGTGPVITPTNGEMSWDKLSIDMQNHLMEIADRVSRLMKRNDTEGAWEELISHDKELDEHGKVLLWSRLDSKERSALKKFSDLRKESERKAA